MDDKSDYAAYTEGERTVRNKTSIIISIIIVLLLLFFTFMIYRKLTTDRKDSSGLFQEESEHEAPLLLPSFKTEPTQGFTIRPRSTTVSTISEATGKAGTSSATQSSETAAGATIANNQGSTTSYSIRVVVNTDLETETVFTEGGDSTEMTDESSAETSYQSSELSSIKEQEEAVHVHIFPDPSSHPLIRLYYGVDIDKDDQGEALFEFSQLKLHIFERLNNNDQWQEQACIFNKENSNISLVANFDQSFETGGSIKASLFDFIDAMKLNHDSPGKEKTEETNDPEAGKAGSQVNISNCWDRFSLVAYGSQLMLQSEMTSYYFHAREAITNANPATGSQLLLHDAIYKAVELAAEEGQGTVVMITDGRYKGNNRSLEEALELATEEKIPVYIIYLRDKTSNTTVDMSDRHSEKTLREFAYKTRGDLFSIDAASEKWQGQLTAALLSALDRDQEDTFLTYISTFKTAPDTRHYVRLEFTFETEDTGEEFKFLVDSLYNIPVPTNKG
ncbi:MAG: VWA domain-containing protein [Clostridiaceae bacterium]|nr:VWA domain-containing protein [Clostridiaceae bacterium]